MSLLIWTLQLISAQERKELPTQHYLSLGHPNNFKKIYRNMPFSESAYMKSLNMSQRRSVLAFVLLLLA